MIPTRNAALALAAYSIALAACTRPPPGSSPGFPGSAGGGPPPAAQEPRRTSAPAPAGVPGPRPSPAAPGAPGLKAAAPDRLIGSRPLVRLLPADYYLGPLEDLSGSVPGPRARAASAARTFLEGLMEGRLEAIGPDARDVIEFMLADLLDPGSRPLGWKLGRGIPRPEGGWIFPILLMTRTGRIPGEAFASEAPGSAWKVDLIVLNREEPIAVPGQEPMPFDPTIRTVKPTGR